VIPRAAAGVNFCEGIVTTQIIKTFGRPSPKVRKSHKIVTRFGLRRGSGESASLPTEVKEVLAMFVLRTSVPPGPDALDLRLPLIQRLHWRPASPATDTAHAQEEREDQAQPQRFHGHLHRSQMATTIAITATIQSHCQSGGGSGERVVLGSWMRPVMGRAAFFTTRRQRGDPVSPLGGQVDTCRPSNGSATASRTTRLMAGSSRARARSPHPGPAPRSTRSPRGR
jgi:hypothetical protein